jgi:isoleucyl-tRNA synthetase
MASFRSVDNSASFPSEEESVLELWEKTRAFPRSVDERPKSNAYVFYDGPPFATGLPHYGHFVANTLKDVIPRYWTMRGKRVERRFGWDTHGLPIEMEIEKQLGLSGPTSVREYGVAKFNETCRENVLRYTEEWRKTITRLGRWVDFDDDYKTMDLSFMESVWWVFEQLFDKGLVYEGERVMPYSWRLSTPLSNFEANLDYRDVEDPAVTVSLPLHDDPDGAHLLIWTTTPWTLPSNLGVAVGTDLDYVRAKQADGDQVYIVAKDLAQQVLGKEAEVLSTLKGSELVGKRYEPLFDYFSERAEQGAFILMASDHVTTDDGTGLVHMAPAYGEDDYVACQKVGIKPVDPVDDEGKFTSAVPDFAGQLVKDADPDIIRALKDKGRLFKRATLKHSYPFCWRSGTPLIYKTVPVWFVQVEKIREQMAVHNQEIHWVPEAVGHKRFGNWLGEARDWAISRNRFWGTPIPLYRCDQDECQALECLGSASALAEKTGEEITDLHPHKIDHLTFPCSQCEGTMKRIPEVFDCWFESGSMPYAQVHYPFEHKEEFEPNFPAEYIAEGLDQTRGWFYTLLVLSTALFDKAPFKNCIVNGMVLAEDGAKMSKSKRNYPDPTKILDEHGADALRAYLINSPVVRAEPLRFSESGVREVVRTVLLPLRNALSFFVQYANIDGWTPQQLEDAPAVAERPELDRWLLSVLQSLVRDVNREMEGYYLYRVLPPMMELIDDLTNWYIRRSRRRFWRNKDDESAQADKASAYATLYETLVTFTKVLAPVTPFLTESLYQTLVVEPGVASNGEDSVHLCRYPEVDDARIDEALERAMSVTRQVVTMGRALREKHKLKTRQPLRAVTVVTHDAEAQEALRAHTELICEELNVREVSVLGDDHALADVSFKPNYKTLGKRMGKKMKAAAAAIAALPRDDWDKLEDGGTIVIEGEELTQDDILVTRTAKGEVVLESYEHLTVALDTHLDDDLVREGLMREVVSRLQRIRKDSGLEVTDRVTVALGTADEQLKLALEEHSARIADEVLAASLEISADVAGDALDVDGHALSVTLTKA